MLYEMPQTMLYIQHEPSEPRETFHCNRAQNKEHLDIVRVPRDSTPGTSCWEQVVYIVRCFVLAVEIVTEFIGRTKESP